jgi:hypothetical protein
MAAVATRHTSTVQERRVGRLSAETLVELRERLQAEAVNSYRFGSDTPEDAEHRRAVLRLLDRVDARLARLREAA